MSRIYSLKFDFVYKGALGSLIFVLILLVLSPSALASDITTGTVIKLVNEARISAGLPELRENSKLDQAAKNKAWDMISRGYFSHTSPSGITPWKWFEKNGYDYKYAGENLAMDFQSAERQQQAWMNSPTHRKNILNPVYEEIGVAVSRGVIDNHVSTITVQMFGTKDSSMTEKDSSSKQKEESNINEEPKVLEDGIIGSANQPLFSAVNLNQNSYIPMGATLGVSGNKFIRISDLDYKIPPGENSSILSQTSGQNSYKTIEIIIWLILVLALCLLIIPNLKVFLTNEGQKNVQPTSLVIILAVMAASVICKFFINN